MPNPAVSFQPPNIFGRDWERRGRVGDLRDDTGARARLGHARHWHRSWEERREHCTVRYFTDDGERRVGHGLHHRPSISAAAACSRSTATSPAAATATATATYAITPGETAATGQDEIYGTATPPAYNDATPVTSVDQGAVRVHARSRRCLSCLIPLGCKASWGKGPRQFSSWLLTDRIF
ncbi:MAG: hypothetical protein M1826_006556 [Phylliscum demangeonii]|nr:MAG: hypothetical protein M1826_006556 [Phylliscum demangeonii]